MAGNYPVKEIANELGRGIAATVMKADDLGVSLRMQQKPERRHDVRDAKLGPSGVDVS